MKKELFRDIQTQKQDLFHDAQVLSHHRKLILNTAKLNVRTGTSYLTSIFLPPTNRIAQTDARTVGIECPHNGYRSKQVVCHERSTCLLKTFNLFADTICSNYI